MMRIQANPGAIATAYKKAVVCDAFLLSILSNALKGEL